MQRCYEVTDSSVLQLEIRLARKEEMLLDKDLVFDQASRLANRVHKKVNAGQDDSLTLAKKVSQRL